MYPDYSFEPHYLEIDGNKLHYIDEGQGPVVILVHGNPTWSYYYRHLIALLAKNFRVIAPDNIGCGFSDKPLDYSYTLKNHTANLRELIAHLNIEKYSLVLHDWGGAIGLGSVVGKNEALENLVLLNTAAFRSKLIPLRIRICKLPYVGEVIVRLFNGFAWPATFMAVTRKMKDEVARAYIAPYNNWNNRIATHRFVKDIPLSTSHASYDQLLLVENNLSSIKDLEVPVQIIWGGKDFCFNDTFFNEWKDRFPNAETTYFEDGGHYILEDKRDEALSLINEFLGK